RGLRSAGTGRPSSRCLGGSARVRRARGGRRRTSYDRHQLGEDDDVVLVVADGAVELAAAGDQLQRRAAVLSHHPVPGEGVLGELLHRQDAVAQLVAVGLLNDDLVDRKGTRLNSRHVKISYAVFGLQKKSR